MPRVATNLNRQDHQRRNRFPKKRRGVSTIDYVLVAGVILPLALFLFAVVPRMVKLVYEFVVVNVTSPMM